jgi:hypothetical protein
VPQEVFDLVEEMLQPDPDDRPVNIEALQARVESLTAWLYEAYAPQDGNGAGRSGQISVAEAMAQELGTADQAHGKVHYDPYAVSGRDAAYNFDAEPPATIPLEDDIEPPVQGQGDKWAMPDTYPLDDPDQYAAVGNQPIAPGAAQAAPAAAAPAPSKPPAASPAKQPPPAPVAAAAAPPPPPTAAAPAEAKPAKAPRNLKFFLVVGGGAVLVLVIGVVAVTLLSGLLSGDGGASPAASTSPRPSAAAAGDPARPAGLQNQTRNQNAKLQKYTSSARKAKLLAAANQDYFDRFGRYPRRIEDLAEVGVTPGQMKDDWARNMDLREEFIVSAGENGKWDDGDDFWVNSATGEIGGFDIPFDLSEDTPILGKPNAAVNDMMEQLGKRRQAEVEAE